VARNSIAPIFWMLALGPTLIASDCAQNPSKSVNSVAAEQTAATFELDVARSQSDLAELTRHPHPLGSIRQREVASWLVSRLTSEGIRAVKEDFNAVTPNPATQRTSENTPLTVNLIGHNIYAMDVGRLNPPCVVALASHYDSKDIAGVKYLGANDSGSSTAVLLQLLTHIKKHSVYHQMTCGFVGWFFDGEESVLANWTDGQLSHPSRMIDHTYGSRMLASKLIPCMFSGKPSSCLPAENGRNTGPAVAAVILLDMIGSPELKLSRDLQSSPELQRIAQRGAALLGLPEIFTEQAASIEDDHRPFRALGIPAIDLIDFQHLKHWHKPSDDVDTLSPASLNIAGHIALYVASSLANPADPKHPTKKINNQ
jgi:hypothetical protein